MAALISFQRTITATGTPQQLPANPVNGAVSIAAPSTNTASITLGNSPGVTATNGYTLAKGGSVTIPLPEGNTNAIWAVGTAGDVFAVLGA